ncbi:MAG: methyltransferase [Candidatus Micrarchaeota archaeon]|nr:methyltransferase [Candidatus Micrarchaeota archaeon]
MYEHVVVKDGVLWIDGIHMQRFHNTTPAKNAELMVQQLGIKRGDNVLDVCTGLGYTVAAELTLGAKVTTIEQSDKVLQLLNESANNSILQNENVKLIAGDAFQEVKKLPPKYFNAVLLDPPRFSMAGQLYSEEFYSDLHRVLKSNGKLFHYTGKPGMRTGKNLMKGIKNRLQEARFHNVQWIEPCLGFKAIV